MSIFYLILFFIFFWDCLNENLGNNRFAIVCDRWRKFLWFIVFVARFIYLWRQNQNSHALSTSSYYTHRQVGVYSRARLLISLVSHFSCSGISNAAWFAVVVIIVVLYVIILLVQQQIHLVSLWRDVEVGETWDDKTPASLWWSNQ